MKTLFYSHIIFAYVSLALLLVRGILSVKKIDWRQYKILKIMPHIADTLLLASGIWIFISFGYSLSTIQPWLMAKLFFLVMYVFYAIKAFKKTQPFSIKHFVLAAVSFMMILFTATFK
ncbi:invasion protein expression up-regulator SirB [Pasteurellaceae bacterium LFhippo2]|nr:invasion protein expression up-regulator SirB [Pasteurellaceae bacterium LFhippo2]